MAKYIQRGETLDYVNSTNSTLSGGSVVALGTHVGIVGGDIPAGAKGVVHVVGVFEMDKITTEAISLGDTLYLDADGKATKTAGSPALTTVIGYAVEAAAQTDTTVLVRLCD